MAELARGTVADRPWGRTFATLGLRAVTGQLALTADGKRFLVAFERGAVVASSSPLAADAAVRVALTTHLVSSSQVPEISRRQAAAPDRDEVELIAELARLGPDHALRLRRRVIAQRAARTFSINQGEFVVTDDTELAILDGCELDVRAVVYIGARSNLPEQRMSAELHQLGAWFRLRSGIDDDLPQFGFGDVEQPVVERLRDGGTLAEIDEFASSFIDGRTVRAVIYALAACGACDVEPAPGQPRSKLVTPRTMTTPLGMAQGRPPSQPIARPSDAPPPDALASRDPAEPPRVGDPAAHLGDPAASAGPTPPRYDTTQPLPVAGAPAIHAGMPPSGPPARGGRPAPAKETNKIATVPPPARVPPSPVVGGAGVARPDFSRAGMRASSDTARRDGTTGPIRVPTREGLRVERSGASSQPPFGEATRRERPSAGMRVSGDDSGVSGPARPDDGRRPTPPPMVEATRRPTPAPVVEATRRERSSAGMRVPGDDSSVGGTARPDDGRRPTPAPVVEATRRERSSAGMRVPGDDSSVGGPARPDDGRRPTPAPFGEVPRPPPPPPFGEAPRRPTPPPFGEATRRERPSTPGRGDGDDGSASVVERIDDGRRTTRPSLEAGGASGAASAAVRVAGEDDEAGGPVRIDSGRRPTRPSFDEATRRERMGGPARAATESGNARGTGGIPDDGAFQNESPRSGTPVPIGREASGSSSRRDDRGPARDRQSGSIRLPIDDGSRRERASGPLRIPVDVSDGSATVRPGDQGSPQGRASGAVRATTEGGTAIGQVRAAMESETTSERVRAARKESAVVRAATEDGTGSGAMRTPAAVASAPMRARSASEEGARGERASGTMRAGTDGEAASGAVRAATEDGTGSGAMRAPAAVASARMRARSASEEGARGERASGTMRAGTDGEAASGVVRAAMDSEPGSGAVRTSAAVASARMRAGSASEEGARGERASGTMRAGSASEEGARGERASGTMRAGTDGEAASGVVRAATEDGTGSGVVRAATEGGTGSGVVRAATEGGTGSGVVRAATEGGTGSGVVRAATHAGSVRAAMAPGDLASADFEAPAGASEPRRRLGSSPGAHLPGDATRYPTRRRAGSVAQPRSSDPTDAPPSREVEGLIAHRLELLDGGADHFALLGVSRDATPELLRKAYFALARQLHPDRLAALGIPDDGKHAQRLFAQVNAAFATLSDPERRARYLDVLRRGGEAAIRAEQARAEELTRRVLAAEEAFRRGELALRRDQPQAAVAEFERAVELSPDEADYHATLAWSRFCATSDKPSVADATRAALERAIELQPRSVTARFYLGRVERMLGRDTEALRRFRDVLAASPGHAEAAAEIRALESRLGPDKPGVFGRTKR